jgi:putative phage-type endonuclease
MNATDKAAWLAARKSGIGGSDVAAILGVSPWKTPVDIYLDKTNQAPAEWEENEPAYWGTVLEEVVATEYARRNGRRVQRINTMLRHPAHNWMLANVDRAIVIEGSRARVDEKTGLVKGAEGVLECKTASAYKAGEWGTAADDDAVPTHYVAQCMWYMAITGLDYCDIAVLIGGQKYLDKRIERDDDTITGMIYRAEEFWFKHVIEGIPPEPTTAKDVSKLFPQDNGQIIEADQATLTAFIKARQLREQFKTLEKDLEEQTDILKIAIGAHSVLTVEGQPVFTYKKAKDSVTTDWQAIANSFSPGADIIKQFTKPKAGSRRALFKE